VASSDRLQRFTKDDSRFTIIERFVVYKGVDDEALFPGLTRAANGDLLVSFCTQFDCQPGGKAFLLRSTDDGRTWGSPARIAESQAQDGCINLSVGLAAMTDGSLLYPCCDARITRKWDRHEVSLLILRSGDDGFTWSQPQPVATAVLEPFAYGKIIEVAGGDLLCPIWGKGSADEPWRSGLVRSRDGGRTWGDYVTIGYDTRTRIPAAQDDAVQCAGFNEATLIEFFNGHLLAVLRQQGVGQAMRQLFQSRSFDHGHSWSDPQPMPLWGTSPSLHFTPSGRLILGYRNHLGNPQGLASAGVGISVSDDCGETWSEHLLLEDPQGYQYQHEFDAGYPAFLDMSGNRLLVVFYSFDPSRSAKRYLAANLLHRAAC